MMTMLMMVMVTLVMLVLEVVVMKKMLMAMTICAHDGHADHDQHGCMRTAVMENNSLDGG